MTQSQNHLREALPTVVVAAALAMAGAVCSYFVSGRAMLGAVIGGLAFISIIVSPMTLASARRGGRSLIALGAAVGVGLVWIALFKSLQFALVSTALAAALAGWVNLLTFLRTPGWLASAVTTALAFAWLSWPVWLAPRLSGQEIVGLLVAVHPVFAANGVDPSMGVWTQQRLMYRMTTLGQDVPYRLPDSVWPCVIAHGVIALSLLLPARPGAAAGDEPSDR